VVERVRTLSRPRFGDGQVCQLRVELDGFVPPVWRRVLVSDRASLHELHLVIEGAFGRDGDAPFCFTVDGVRYHDAESGAQPGHLAERVALDDLGLTLGARLRHESEGHGDPWQHILTLEQVAPRLVGQRLPSCVAGGRAAPPDGCVGPRAYHDLLDALGDPFSARAAEWIAWLPDDFDPGFADVTGINAALARVPKRRTA
jgi:hypothetical protein